MTSLDFTVIGIPAPQGSKSPWGTEANPNTLPWRATVAAKAHRAAMDVALTSEGVETLWGLNGCVLLQVIFYFPRPKSHYRTGRHAGELKPHAPELHGIKPDLDKLLRAIGDALTGTVLRDDAQIVSVDACKRYGEPARAEIRISPA